MHGFEGEKRADEAEVVVLRVRAQVAENAVLPQLLHVSPVVDFTTAHRVVDLHALLVHGVVTNVEVKVLNAHALGGVLLFVRGNRRWDDVRGL